MSFAPITIISAQKPPHPASLAGDVETVPTQIHTNGHSSPVHSNGPATVHPAADLSASRLRDRYTIEKAAILADLEGIEKSFQELHAEHQAFLEDMRFVHSQHYVTAKETLTANYERQIADLHQERDSLLAELENSTKLRASLTSQRELLVKELDKFLQEKEGGRAQLSRQLADLKQRAGKQEQQLQDAIDSLEADRKPLLKSFTEISEAASQKPCDQKDSGMQNPPIEHAEKLAHIKAKLDSNGRALTQKDTELETLKLENQQRIEELDAQLSLIDVDIHREDDSILHLDIAEIDSQLIRLDEHSTRLRDAEERIAECHAKHKGHLEELEHISKEMEQDCVQKQSNFDRANEELQEAQTAAKRHLDEVENRYRLDLSAIILKDRKKAKISKLEPQSTAAVTGPSTPAAVSAPSKKPLDGSTVPGSASAPLTQEEFSTQLDAIAAISLHMMRHSQFGELMKKANISRDGLKQLFTQLNMNEFNFIKTLDTHLQKVKDLFQSTQKRN